MVHHPVTAVFSVKSEAKSAPGSELAEKGRRVLKAEKGQWEEKWKRRLTGAMYKGCAQN